MKKGIIAVVVLVLAALGFALGLIVSAEGAGCTEMYCGCGFPNPESANYTGETPCNSCGTVDPIFVLGIFNIVKTCEAREIVICENGERINKRIDVDFGSCRLRFGFLELY